MVRCGAYRAWLLGLPDELGSPERWLAKVGEGEERRKKEEKEKKEKRREREREENGEEKGKEREKGEEEKMFWIFRVEIPNL